MIASNGHTNGVNGHAYAYAIHDTHQPDQRDRERTCSKRIDHTPPLAVTWCLLVEGHAGACLGAPAREMPPASAPIALLPNPKEDPK